MMRTKITNLETAVMPLRELKWLHQWYLNQAADCLSKKMKAEQKGAMRAYEKAATALEILMDLHVKGENR